MHRTILGLTGLTVALIAGLTFGQGLGITPAMPDGMSALTVTPEAGPWMILAASYSGPPSRAMAEELATEIRTRYNLPAYVFNRTAEERRAEQERIARLKEERKKQYADAGIPEGTAIHIKTVRIEDQYAVLVGGYKDDVTARKKLDEFRKLKPPSSNLQQSRYVADASGKMHEEAINPFLGAFVCHNPSMPVEKPKQDADLSKRLKEYNAPESFSLLKCPKPYTLVVKEYKGAATLQSQGSSSSTMEKLSLGRKSGELLNGNAKAAHMTAEYLRNSQLGFDAYVLHTEFNSYVTIGAFDSQDDPRLTQTMQHFLKELNRPGSGVNQLHMRTQFMTNPMPMPVPQVK